jgi:hypothetical protein
MITKPTFDLHRVGSIEWDRHRDSAVVPDWLNAAKGTESYARVTRLIDEIRQVETGLDKAVKEGWYYSSAGKPESGAVIDQIGDLNRRHDGINEMLSRYSFSPILQRILLGHTWMLSMSSAPAPDEFTFRRVVHEERKNTSDKMVEYFHQEQSVGEADVVLRILNLAAASELDRVEQCKHCLRWLYAERSHQRFCSPECRLAQYSKSPKLKNYRKLYMRQHRAKEAARHATKSPRGKGK